MLGTNRFDTAPRHQSLHPRFVVAQCVAVEPFISEGPSHRVQPKLEILCLKNDRPAYSGGYEIHTQIKKTLTDRCFLTSFILMPIVARDASSIISMCLCFTACSRTSTGCAVIAALNEPLHGRKHLIFLHSFCQWCQHRKFEFR